MLAVGSMEDSKVSLQKWRPCPTVAMDEHPNPPLAAGFVIIRQKFQNILRRLEGSVQPGAEGHA